MMTRSWRALVGLALVGATLGFARCSRPAPRPAAEGASPDSLRTLALALSDELSTAYRHGDWPALAALLAPDYLGTVPGERADRAQLKLQFPKTHLIDVRRGDYVVKLLAQGVLLLNEDVILQETYEGQDISGRYRMTTIWGKDADRWRLDVTPGS